MIIVEGLLPNGQDHFASELNASLAQALDAEVVLVSTADIQNPRKTAEKVEAHLRQFGGATSNRTAGVLFMRTRGLSEETAQIPVALTRRYVQPKTSQNLRQNCKNITATLDQAIYQLLV